MRYARNKLLVLIPVLLAVSFLTYLLLDLLPGDPARTLLGTSATEENLARVREELGLNDPLPVRYVDWLGGVVQGDLGASYRSGLDVRGEILDKLGVTLLLMMYAQVLALAVAIPLGIVAAYKAGSRFDRAINTVAFGFLSVPPFVLAQVLILLFALNLGWFNVVYDEDLSKLTSLALPALTIALGQIAVYMRLLRTDMVATLQEDYITMAKAKGLGNRFILLRHAFRPSSFTLLTVAGINFGALVGGAFVVEYIFAIPGIGQLLVNSIRARDYLLVQGCVLVVAFAYVLVNFVVDMLYAVLDPRIRHARALA